jgi:alpha-beta hydrolase superfamily lysophospholipase
LTPLVVVLVGAAAAGGIYTLNRLANEVVRPVPREPSRTVPDAGLDYEDFTIASGEHRLAAWLLRGGAGRGRTSTREPACEPTGEEVQVDEAPLFVLAHGWGASYGTVLQLAEPLARAGHEVLLFDMRGHGRNRAVPYVTVRHLRDDVGAVARYASERFPGRPLVVVGHSFGGAASVLAAAEGARFAALVLIAAPADVVEITAEYLTARGMPGALMATVLRPFWWWRLGGTFVPHSPVRRIGELDIPVLIIQPEHDQRVHRTHAERLAEAAGVEYHLVRDREHTDVLGAAETVRLVTSFAEGLGAAPRRPAPSGTTTETRGSTASRAS